MFLLFAIFCTVSFVGAVIYAFIHIGEIPHTGGGQLDDAFPGNNFSNKPSSGGGRKLTKEELEEIARKKRLEEASNEQARRIVSEYKRKLEVELRPLFEEYDKDHFYDVTNQRWVKREENGVYVESYHWCDWDGRGRKEPYTEVDIGELITRKEYEAHKDYYSCSWNRTKYSEDEDD